MARGIDWPEPADGGFDVMSGEFMVVTPDASDCEPLARLSAVLRRVRSAFGVEAVFVSEWAGGEPLLRPPQDSANALHALYGRQLLDAPAPRRCAFRFESTPVAGQAGIEYGTLCWRLVVDPQQAGDAPLEALQSVARLIAEWFDEAASLPA